MCSELHDGDSGKSSAHCEGSEAPVWPRAPTEVAVVTVEAVEASPQISETRLDVSSGDVDIGAGWAREAQDLPRLASGCTNGGTGGWGG